MAEPSDSRFKTCIVAFGPRDEAALWEKICAVYRNPRILLRDYFEDPATRQSIRPPDLTIPYRDRLTQPWNRTLIVWDEPADFEPFWLGPNEHGIYFIANQPPTVLHYEPTRARYPDDSGRPFQEGRLWGRVDREDKEGYRKLSSVMRFCDKISSRDMVQFNADTDEPLALFRSGYRFGPHFAELMRREPDSRLHEQLAFPPDQPNPVYHRPAAACDPAMVAALRAKAAREAAELAALRAKAADRPPPAPAEPIRGRSQSRTVVFGPRDEAMLWEKICAVYRNPRILLRDYAKHPKTRKPIWPPNLTVPYRDGLTQPWYDILIVWDEPADFEPVWTGPDARGFYSIANEPPRVLTYDPTLSQSAQYLDINAHGHGMPFKQGLLSGTVGRADKEGYRKLSSIMRFCDKLCSRDMIEFDRDTDEPLELFRSHRRLGPHFTELMRQQPDSRISEVWNVMINLPNHVYQRPAAACDPAMVAALRARAASEAAD